MSIADRLDVNKPSLPYRLVRRTAGNLARWLSAPFATRRIRQDGPRPAWTHPARLAAGAGAAIVVVALTMTWLDSSAIVQQRKLQQPVIDAFSVFTDFGRSGWVLYPIAAILIALAAMSSDAVGRTNRLVLESLIARLGFVFLAIAVPGAAVGIVKRLIGRARPLLWEKGGAFSFDPFRWDVDYASLPSGHGTTAFATAFALGALFPRARLFFWAFAVAIGISRVAVSAHYPSDVIAGGLIGVFGALAVRNWFATRRLAFAVAPDRSVQTLPGPSLRRIGRVARSVWR